MIGRGAVAGNGDVPDDSDAKQCPDVGVVRLRFEWVPEEEHQVDVAHRHLGTELLIAAEWPASMTTASCATT